MGLPLPNLKKKFFDEETVGRNLPTNQSINHLQHTYVVAEIMQQ